MTLFEAIPLPARIDDSWWTISPLTGNLIRHREWKSPPTKSSALPAFVADALYYCDNPYECHWDPVMIREPVGKVARERLEKLSRRLIALGNSRFLLSVLYSGLTEPLFNTTRAAFGEISMLADQALHKEELCLPRSLLAAKISRSFRNGGVLFIGAMVESLDMHAWIIERGEQPDPEDRTWINYRPLLAYTCNR